MSLGRKKEGEESLKGKVEKDSIKDHCVSHDYHIM